MFAARGKPVDGLWPTRCEPCRHRTARFDRLGESGRLKIDRDDTLSDGSARDSATRRSRPRVETRPIDAGRASLETEPDDRVPRCGSPAVYGGRGCHLFVLLMPLLIVFWIPGVGPFTLISRFVQRLAGFYAPILFMTLPVALLLRLGELLGESFSLSLGGVGAWLLALLIPVAALFAPLVMFWQAGALFSSSPIEPHGMPLGRAQQRVSRMRDGSERSPRRPELWAWRGRQACGEQRQSTTAGQQSIASPQRRVTSESGTESTPIRIR